jgi:hypothetical protein
MNTHDMKYIHKKAAAKPIVIRLTGEWAFNLSATVFITTVMAAIWLDLLGAL